MSQSNETSKEWIKLEPFPFSWFGAPFIVNDNHNEIIVAPEKHVNAKSKGLMKYDVNSDKWCNYECMEYPDKYESVNHTTSFDEEKQILYIFRPHLLKIDIKSAKYELIKDLGFNSDFMLDPCSFIIANKLHLIGCDDESEVDHHYIYNENTNKFVINHTFNKKSKSVAFKVKSKNIVLILRNSEIYQYDVISNKWKTSGFDVADSAKPNDICGGIITSDEKYIITFCLWSEDIFTFDVDTKVFSLSKIKLPNDNTENHAVLISNYPKSKVIVHGFITRFQKTLTIIFPNDLIKLVLLYYVEEYMHLLGEEDGDHWKISLTDLLD